MSDQFLFEGEPEKCSLCGEKGHTLFQHEPVQALQRLLEQALNERDAAHDELERRTAWCDHCDFEDK